MRKSQGFTLIELMITLAVLGVITAMAAPSFVNQIRKNEVNIAAKEIVSIASEARSEAILRRDSKTLGISSGASGADISWLPSEHVLWDAAPPLLEYNYFGNLVGSNQCFVLKHTKDESIKAIIYFNKDGSVRYTKDQTTCEVGE